MTMENHWSLKAKVHPNTTTLNSRWQMARKKIKGQREETSLVALTVVHVDSKYPFSFKMSVVESAIKCSNSIIFSLIFKMYCLTC